MSDCREVAKKDIFKIVTVSATILSLVIIGGAALFDFLFPGNSAVFVLFAVSASVFYIYWLYWKYPYRCSNCGHEFKVIDRPINFINIMSLHGFDKSGEWRLLICPSCRQKTKARMLVKPKSA